MTIPRRQFLTYLGWGSTALLAGTARTPAQDFPLKRRKGKPPSFFEPISPSSADELVLAQGLKSNVVISWGDKLGTKTSDGSEEAFGFNNDFIAYFPIDALKGGRDAGEGLLWVNHEYPNAFFQGGYTDADAKAGKRKTYEQVMTEALSVGGSVVHVRRNDGQWSFVPGSKFNRRITATYPQMSLTGPAATLVPEARGSLANCSGGRTPWMTALSCEENYPDFNAVDAANEFYRWSEVPQLAIDELQYGWIMEVDPFGELPPRKHTALGRFKHENAAVTVGPTGRLVVYMGDDEVDQCLYKFVSAEPVPAKGTRAEKSHVLTNGTLYAADMAKGQWIPLVWNEQTKAAIHASLDYKQIKAKYPTFSIANQAELLINTRLVAKALGATPLDRCEDCEIHPLDGSLYVALTNNTKHGNLFGHIVRLVEDKDNPEGTSFRYEIFLAGGPQSGLACPDNLAFDKAGNLWVVCDMSSNKIGKGAYKPFGNNGLYVCPTAGESAGDAFQLASGPCESELTGIWFTEDQSTLFLSVQHPGEYSQSMQKLTSHWPGGGTSIPKPSVVAVTGFRW